MFKIHNFDIYFIFYFIFFFWGGGVITRLDYFGVYGCFFKAKVQNGNIFVMYAKLSSILGGMPDMLEKNEGERCQQ